jgi:hypothetical protein
VLLRESTLIKVDNFSLEPISVIDINHHKIKLWHQHTNFVKAITRFPPELPWPLSFPSFDKRNHLASTLINLFINSPFLIKPLIKYNI